MAPCIFPQVPSRTSDHVPKCLEGCNLFRRERIGLRRNLVRLILVVEARQRNPGLGLIAPHEVQDAQ